MKRRSHELVTSGAASVAVHGAVLGLLLLVAWKARVILRPLHLPGSRAGTHLALTYSLGGPSDTRETTPVRTAVHKETPRKRPTPRPTPVPEVASAESSEKGMGSSGENAFGDQNLRIALPQVHPRPQPDLSVLPHGSAGDVVVDVEISEVGKVTGTKLVKGLAPSVDNEVMAALRGWTFQPATLNGQNVASEQEVLIHYERG